MSSEGNAVAAPDLEQLKTKVEALAEKVVSLKSSGADKDVIGATVKELVDSKREYANANGGIGVDGKKWEEPMSKSERKKKEKEEKKKKMEAEAAAAAGGATNEVSAENAAKKAAKKAEAKAKKAALKAAAAAGGGGGGGKAPAAAAPAAAKAAAKKTSAAKTPPTTSLSTSKLPPHNLAINPNHSLNDRPLVALTVAVLTGAIVELNLVSDHTRPNSALGLPSGGEVVGDLAMARYIARTWSSSQSNMGQLILGADDASSQSAIDQFVDYALIMSKKDEASRIKGIAMTLNRILVNQTFVASATSITLADIALYAGLGFPSQHAAKVALNKALSGGNNNGILRWLNVLTYHPAIRQATQLAVGITGNDEAVFDEDEYTKLEPLVAGMNALEGATPGQVVTRFPPEPSGYLHVGHAKACLLNDYYARRYRGRLILRFDDTNPSKEKEEYQASIIEDLAKLGVKPDVVTFTSDYFPTIRGYAERLIEAGNAFMDDTPQEQMQQERMDRVESVHRNQTVKETMDKFKLMCSGKAEGAKWCLRAKIDMSSVNGTMRDPVLFRQNAATAHHRSGTMYKAYPTYDLACPIVDSLEGVTHALRTTEYNDRDEQYRWIQKTLDLRPTRIHSFARMNFMYTVLSKRKLTWFVENGYVTGWDDARFPTVRGVVRRGIDIGSLRNFMCSQGASRRVVNMEWNKFWAENKQEIDKRAKRFMAIDKENHVKLTVTNGPDVETRSFASADCHPKDPSIGKRIVRLAKEVLLEAVDADGVVEGEEIVLMRWGVVKITKVDGGLEGTYLPDGDFKAAKRKLSWIASVAENTPCVLTEFDNLIIKEKLEEDDKFEDNINPDTLATSDAIGDAGLKALKENDIIQLERRGYYRVDRPYVNETKPLILYMIPDGKAKAMSGLKGKLAHR